MLDSREFQQHFVDQQAASCMIRDDEIACLGRSVGLETRNDIVAEMFEETCERCGAIAQGREQWMFHQGKVPAKEFYCSRCLRVMHIYAIIGYSLLGVLMTGFVVALWWLGVF